jgi:hypothetical protein
MWGWGIFGGVVVSLIIYGLYKIWKAPDSEFRNPYDYDEQDYI